MELSDVINRIIQDYGKDVIAERRFIYMLADYYSFRDNPAEKRVITTIVIDGYTTCLLNCEEDSDISVITNRIINEVCRNYGYREELVKDILTYIVAGIGFHFQSKSNLSRPSIESVTKIENKSDTFFYLKRTTNGSQIICDAEGHYNYDDGSFVIHKGSFLCMRLLNLKKHIETNGDKYIIRKFILDKKCCLQRNGLYLVEMNITCSSPSDAAFIVTCKETNGLNVWKDKKGKSLKQFLNEQNR